MEEDDPAVTAMKAKSDAKNKLQTGFQNFSSKIETLEHKFDDLKRKMRKKPKDESESSRASAEDEKKDAEKPKDAKKKGSNASVGSSGGTKDRPKSATKKKKSPRRMELYYFTPSPPCRAVMLFMHALSLDPIMKEIDISKGDNLKPEYVKLNPQRTIPVIVDDGFVLSESRAILGYLAEQYGGENGTYYPNNPKARGVINQRLLFDIGTLYQRFLDAYMEMFHSNQPTGLDQEKVMKLREAFDFLEIFMGDSDWMAGDEITIADYSLVVTVSTIEACGFDLSEYSRVTNWLERCKREMVNYEEANQRGADIFGQLVKEKLKMAES